MPVLYQAELYWCWCEPGLLFSVTFTWAVGGALLFPLVSLQSFRVDGTGVLGDAHRCHLLSYRAGRAGTDTQQERHWLDFWQKTHLTAVFPCCFHLLTKNATSFKEQPRGNWTESSEFIHVLDVWVIKVHYLYEYWEVTILQPTIWVFIRFN